MRSLNGTRHLIGGEVEPHKEGKWREEGTVKSSAGKQRTQGGQRVNRPAGGMSLSRGNFTSG
jgi:hypothetical protein